MRHKRARNSAVRQESETGPGHLRHKFASRRWIGYRSTDTQCAARDRGTGRNPPRFAELARSGKEIMPDDLRFCALGCCYFVNGRPTTQYAYELSARAYLLGLTVSEADQTMIPCAKAGDGINYALARKLGFYTGLR